MKKNVLTVAILITAIWSSVFSQENPFTTRWDNGFKVESQDGRFKMKFGGRLMYDIAYFDQDASLEEKFGEFKSGQEFRRARFYNSGKIYGNVEYKLQLDFAGGEVVFKDVFIQISDIPVVGNLRVGNFKEPFRLEVLTSSRHITFMERSFHVPFSPERNTGMMLFDEALNERLGWQVGVFRNGDESGSDGSAGDAYTFTARVGGLPLSNSDRSRLLHIGAGFSSRSPKDDVYKVTSRASAHLSPKYVSTGSIPVVDNVLLTNFEISGVLGPLSLDAELLNASVDVPGSQDISFHAYYGQVSYFLTGEHRVYKSVSEGYDRVKPKSNAGDGAGGKGAWEVAARYASIDLNDGPVSGGQMNEFTLGVNWYLNPATKIMANYVRADIKDIGNVGIIQTRFQVDF